MKKIKKINVKYYYRQLTNINSVETVILIDNRIILKLDGVNNLKRITPNYLLNNLRIDNVKSFNRYHADYELIKEEIMYGISVTDVYNAATRVIKHSIGSDIEYSSPYIKDKLKQFNNLYYNYKQLIEL